MSTRETDVGRLADEAVRWVADELHRRPAVVALPGARGRFQTEQDLRQHVDFLEAAVAAGAAALFVDYARWSAAVLESRRMPVQALDDSFALLAEFYRQVLKGDQGRERVGMLEEGREALTENRDAVPVIYGARSPGEFPEVWDFTQSLLEGDVARARQIAQARWSACGDYLAVATGLFQPALYEIGTAWQRNVISVAQEHLATAICQTLLAQLYLGAEPSSRARGRVAVFAGVEGNHHEIGVRMISDAFELAGWSVQYLGADVPTGALVRHVNGKRPAVVGLSVSMVQHIPTLQRAVARLRAELGAQCPVILVGGLATRRFPDLGRLVGADLWADDPQGAVEAVA